MGLKTHGVVTFDEKGHYAWLVWCPACDEPHSFDARWTFNGDHERPSFQASMLVEGGHKSRCHSFLTNGVWHYCGDSGHELANKTAEAPDWASTRFGGSMDQRGVCR